MTALLLALAGTVAAPAHDGVPESVRERARQFLEAAMEGVPGEVRLELFRTRAEMERAVARTDPHPPRGFVAYYEYRSRTVYAWMAPRPEPALYADRLPGLLLGALAHEAQHARGHSLSKRYRMRPAHLVEGEADRDAVRFLRACGERGSGAWELLLESRVLRGRRHFLDPEAFARVDPRRLPAPARATWYAQAYDLARAGPAPELEWVLWDGSAEPLDAGRYRLIAARGEEARLVRSASGPLEVDVVPLAAGNGPLEILHGARDDGACDRILIARDGGVRALWADGRAERRYPAPPLPAGRSTRLAFHRGTLAVNGAVVLHVQERPGRRGFGVRDGAAEFRVVSPRASGSSR